MRKASLNRAPRSLLLCATRKGVLSIEGMQPTGAMIVGSGGRKELQSAVLRCCRPTRHNRSLYIVRAIADAKTDEEASHQARLFADEIALCLSEARAAA